MQDILANKKLLNSDTNSVGADNLENRVKAQTRRKILELESILLEIVEEVHYLNPKLSNNLVKKINETVKEYKNTDIPNNLVNEFFLSLKEKIYFLIFIEIFSKYFTTSRQYLKKNDTSLQSYFKKCLNLKQNEKLKIKEFHEYESAVILSRELKNFKLNYVKNFFLDIINEIKRGRFMKSFSITAIAKTNNIVINPIPLDAIHTKLLLERYFKDNQVAYLETKKINGLSIGKENSKIEEKIVSNIFLFDEKEFILPSHILEVKSRKIDIFWNILKSIKVFLKTQARNGKGVLFIF